MAMTAALWAYADARLGDPAPELRLLTDRLSPPARVLDVGCGAGRPVTAELSNFGSVVGVDISSAQIAIARRNLPSVELICGDIMAQEFETGSFDAIVT